MLSHLEQITGVIIVAILLSVGRAKILPGARSNALLLWVAFVVTVICGLILGWSLYDLVAWLTGLRGGAGGVVGSVGALIALTGGWYSVQMLTAMIRDLVDGRPDDDARKAALWIPTCLPAGWTAVWGVVSHPHGIGTGIVAAAMALITIVFVRRIVNDAMKARKGQVAWLWFAAGICLIGGLVATPLVLYVDGFAAKMLPHTMLLCVRLLGGAFGLALLVAAVKDIADKVPDAAVRAFLSVGLPLVLAFGAVTVATISGEASNGGQILTGSMR